METQKNNDKGEFGLVATHPRCRYPEQLARSRGSSRSITLIARLMGLTWGPSGADRTQVGPMLAPWTLLSGYTCNGILTSRQRQAGTFWPCYNIAHYSTIWHGDRQRKRNKTKAAHTYSNQSPNISLGGEFRRKFSRESRKRKRYGNVSRHLFVIVGVSFLFTANPSS